MAIFFNKNKFHKNLLITLIEVIETWIGYFCSVSDFNLFSIIMRGANTNMTISAPAPLNPREKSLEDYRKQLKVHKELSSKLKQSLWRFLMLLLLSCPAIMLDLYNSNLTKISSERRGENAVQGLWQVRERSEGVAECWPGAELNEHNCVLRFLKRFLFFLFEYFIDCWRSLETIDRRKMWVLILWQLLNIFWKFCQNIVVAVFVAVTQGNLLKRSL